MIDEEGIVVESRGGTALVRAVPGSQCSGCAAAGSCQSGAGREREVEADNSLGAEAGERVVMSVPSGDLLKASFQVYMIPVIGVLLGAGAAQTVVQVMAGPAAAGAAAGLGGVAGVLLSVLAVRAYRKRHPESAALRPRISKILGKESVLDPS